MTKSDDTAVATKGDLKPFVTTEHFDKALRKYATKDDVKRLDNDLKSLDAKLTKRLDMHDRQFEVILEHIDRSTRLLEKKIEEGDEKIFREVQVLLEQQYYNYIDMRKEDVELLKDKDVNHEQRLVRLESHTGLQPIS